MQRSWLLKCELNERLKTRSEVIHKVVEPVSNDSSCWVSNGSSCAVDEAKGRSHLNEIATTRSGEAYM